MLHLYLDGLVRIDKIWDHQSHCLHHGLDIYYIHLNNLDTDTEAPFVRHTRTQRRMDYNYIPEFVHHYSKQQ